MGRAAFRRPRETHAIMGHSAMMGFAALHAILRGMAPPQAFLNSSSRRFCRLLASKLSTASQASKASRIAGHSLSMMENQAVSRLRPLIIMFWRNNPS